MFSLNFGERDRMINQFKVTITINGSHGNGKIVIRGNVRVNTHLYCLSNCLRSDEYYLSLIVCPFPDNYSPAFQETEAI